MDDQKLKVLQITPLYPTPQKPAFGIFVKTQIESLQDKAQIDIFHLPGGNGIFPYLKYIPKILSKLRGDYHIVHIHHGSSASLVKILNVFSRKKIVTSYCGEDLFGELRRGNRYSVKSNVLKKINRFCARFDTHAIVKSEALKNVIKASSQPISVIPNGTDISLFNVQDKIECRRKLKIPIDRRKVIVFPADAHNINKNYQLIHRALEKLDPSTYHIYTFAGKRVPYNLVPLFLNAADLIVFSSISEGSPNVIKEAMACNCNIYSTPVGDVKWLLQGVQGSRVIGYEQQLWEESLRQFVLQPGKVESNSREVLLQKGLDLESTAQRIISVYQSLMEPNNPKP